MNRPTESDTIDLLLAVALVTIEAITTLIVALVALLLTVARWRPAATAEAPPAPAATNEAPPPAVHRLHELAADLEALPVSTLRPMAGVTSKRHRKHELVAQLVAC